MLYLYIKKTKTKKMYDGVQNKEKKWIYCRL